MVTFEEWVVPIFTKAGRGRRRHGVQLRRGRRPRRDGLARAGCDRARVERRGRRLRAARVERDTGRADCRRDRRSSRSIRSARGGMSATKVGATHVLDPERRRRWARHARPRAHDLAHGSRLWSGGRNPAGRRPGAGADFVVEAAGLEHVHPKLEHGPDPTRHSADAAGLSDVRARRASDHDRASSRGNITLPGNLFSIGGVTHHGGQAGGAARCGHPALRRDARERPATTRSRWRRPSCRSNACSRPTNRSPIARRSRRS